MNGEKLTTLGEDALDLMSSGEWVKYGSIFMGGFALSSLLFLENRKNAWLHSWSAKMFSVFMLGSVAAWTVAEWESAPQYHNEQILFFAGWATGMLVGFGRMKLETYKQK